MTIAQARPACLVPLSLAGWLAACGGAWAQQQDARPAHIERIEVTKSPTPDMDGDSIGGAVNLVSKSAFDSSPQRPPLL